MRLALAAAENVLISNNVQHFQPARECRHREARFPFVCYFRTCPNKLRTAAGRQYLSVRWFPLANKCNQPTTTSAGSGVTHFDRQQACLPGALIVLYGFFLVPVVLQPRCRTSLALHIAPESDTRQSLGNWRQNAGNGKGYAEVYPIQKHSSSNGLKIGIGFLH